MKASTTLVGAFMSTRTDAGALRSAQGMAGLAQDEWRPERAGARLSA
ncbi:hypothetical protein [Cryobacterium sp. Y82]|nr:hypothetical protein [Cryobacterium sp. Y82]